MVLWDLIYYKITKYINLFFRKKFKHYQFTFIIYPPPLEPYPFTSEVHLSSFHESSWQAQHQSGRMYSQ